ncbi:MAG: CinA family protein [Pseudomonadota bacterium]
MFDDELTLAASQVLEAARARGALVVTAESCTGGLVAAALTAIAGSSDVVDGGFITYSNAAKAALGVPQHLLDTDGAVSESVARALAEAARRTVLARTALPTVSVSVTGVAGPGGGSAEKPVGLVHFAATSAFGTVHQEVRFGDLGRADVRRQSILTAFSMLREVLTD